MKKPPAFPLYAQDFLTGVVYLTNEEVGQYIKMLCKQWTDGGIPKKRLGFLVGKNWDDLSDELKIKFCEKNDFVYNERLEFERNKKLKFSEKQSINGKLGGRGNKAKPLKNIKPNESQKKPLEKEYEKEKEKEDVLEVEIYPNFQDFWDIYDKKVGMKDKIEKKWNNLSQKVKEKIIEFIPLYIDSEPNKKYRKNPETFLNNASWEDEIIIKDYKKTEHLSPMETILNHLGKSELPKEYPPQ